LNREDAERGLLCAGESAATYGFENEEAPSPRLSRDPSPLSREG